METDTVLWRRLETPGHDACRLIQRNGTWRLEGVAAFLHEGAPACVAYELECFALLQVNETGFVEKYPELWEAETLRAL